MFHTGDHRREFLKGTRRHGSYRFPTKKFLRKYLGHQWSEVHSKLSKEFDRRTDAGRKFWKNLDGWEIATNCWVGAESGLIFQENSGWRSGAVDGFYVHPWTGKLCFQNRPPFYNSYTTNKCICGKKEEIPAIGGVLLNEAGIWYFAKKIPYISVYSGFTYKKRQLRSKELKRNNLTNNPYIWEEKICDICFLVQKYKHLQKCLWCPGCDMWICQSDQSNPLDRSLAFEIRRKLAKEKSKQGDQWQP